MQNVIVFVEHKNASTRKVTYELATEARRLADELGGKAHGIVLGNGAATVAENVKAYPLDVIHVSEDRDINAYFLDPVIDYLEAVAREVGSAVILIPNTMFGRDVAGRIAARLDVGLNSDVTGIVVEGGRVACVMPKLGGSAITTCAFKDGDFGVATVRPNAFPAQTGGAGAQIVTIDKPAGKTYLMSIDSEADEISTEMGLEEAPAVVAGGRGMGGAEPFDTLLKPLAQALGGTVGASRAAADAGWVPYSLQIGQTGRTISPNIYIAVGISGAIQHKVGMRTAGTIVAINKDAAVPIGEFADLMVVGNLFDIVPELTKLVESNAAVHA